MKLILKEDIAPLGRMGDLIDVADGYARNFLLPKKKATIATTKNVKLFEHEKRVIADRVRKERLSAEGTAGKIEALTISAHWATAQREGDVLRRGRSLWSLRS